MDIKGHLSEVRFFLIQQPDSFWAAQRSGPSTKHQVNERRISAGATAGMNARFWVLADGELAEPTSAYRFPSPKSCRTAIGPMYVVPVAVGWGSQAQNPPLS
jgi:hypothetical protein